MMAKLKWFLGRKAARATVRHTAHGVTAKVKRQPLRSAKLSASARRSASRPGSSPDASGGPRPPVS